MNVSIHIDAKEAPSARVRSSELANSSTVDLSIGGCEMTLFFYGLSEADVAPLRDEFEKLFRKVRGETAPSFQIAAE